MIVTGIAGHLGELLAFLFEGSAGLAELCRDILGCAVSRCEWIGLDYLLWVLLGFFILLSYCREWCFKEFFLIWLNVLALNINYPSTFHPFHYQFFLGRTNRRRCSGNRCLACLGCFSFVEIFLEVIIIGTSIFIVRYLGIVQL